VGSTESAQGLPAEAACWLCGRSTYDPSKRETPWARGVAGGRQVLVCPACQASVPGWMDRLDQCERCGGTRLSAMLGEVVCRSCGALQSGDSPDRPDEPGA
jgi:hypothetical protein